MKYLESKIDIADNILSIIHSYIFTNNIETYIEPFVGGANIIDKVQCSNRLAFDINNYLIEMFNYLLKNDNIPEYISKEQYLDVMAHYKAKDKYYENWFIAFVGYMTSTNGTFFDKRVINLKDNNYNQIIRSNISELTGQIKGLEGTKFSSCDYTELNPKNSLIYCDAPNCTHKVKNKFNYDNYWSIVRNWSKENIVLVSEFNAPEDFDIIWEENELNTENRDNTEKLFIHHSLNNTTVDFNF